MTDFTNVEPLAMAKAQRSYSMQPAAELRWNMIGVDGDGKAVKVLQQAWSVTEYEGGRPVAQTTEWRDVPHHFD
jgi:hypothetical protein